MEATVRIKVDLTQLREQKSTLYNLMTNIKDENVQNDLDGILHLIDGIQDYAVDALGLPEEDVFNLESSED